MRHDIDAPRISHSLLAGEIFSGYTCQWLSKIPVFFPSQYSIDIINITHITYAYTVEIGTRVHARAHTCRRPAVAVGTYMYMHMSGATHRGLLPSPMRAHLHTFV